MATASLTSRTLRALPYATLLLTFAWTALDILHVTRPRWDVALWILFAAASAFSVPGYALDLSSARQVGLVLLVAAYLLAHIVELGVDVLAGVSFVTIVILHAEFRFLAERFAPILGRSLSPETRRAMHAALVRAFVRLTIASGAAVFVPVLAADLALTGSFRPTTIPTAILLAAGLVAVVLVLALLPTFGRGPTGPESRSSRRR